MRLREATTGKTKNLITETYVKKVSNSIILHELAKVFADYKLLGGNLEEDVSMLIDFSGYLMEKGDSDEFDPFGYLQHTGKLGGEKTGDSEAPINPAKDCVLSMTDSNTKLDKLQAVSFELPAGYTCPFADICKSIANRHGKEFGKTGKKIKDYGEYRCFAASQEAQYPGLRNKRWRNLDLLKQAGGAKEQAELILRSLKYFEQTKRPIGIFRIHSSGDFFDQPYFDAWLNVIKHRTDILFYAYTKSLPYWKERMGEIPKNFNLIASEGGKNDYMIDQNKFRKAVILPDMDAAKKRKLSIDVNDFLAAFDKGDFGMLLHGTQGVKGGMNKQSRENSVFIKKYAAKLDLTADKLKQLIANHTSPRPKSQPMTFRNFNKS